MKKFFFVVLITVLTSQFAKAQDYFWPLTSNLTDTKGGLVGTNHGVQFSSDAVRGNVAVFDGNSYANLPQFLMGNPEVTVAVWFKMDEIRPWSRVYSFGSGDQTDPKNVMMIIPVTGAADPVKNWFRFTITNSTGPWLDADVDTALVKVKVGEWNHSVMVVTADSIIGYFNNQRIIEEAYITDLTTFADTQNALGKSFWADAFFKGALSDLRVYNSKLSNADVNTLYNQTLMKPSAVQSVSANNPSVYAVKNSIKVDLKQADQSAVVKVYSITGSLIAKADASKISNQKFNTGIYMIQVNGTGINYSTKLIIK
jgi:hypothetical protein